MNLLTSIVKIRRRIGPRVDDQRDREDFVVEILQRAVKVKRDDFLGRKLITLYSIQHNRTLSVELPYPYLVDVPTHDVVAYILLLQVSPFSARNMSGSVMEA